MPRGRTISVTSTSSIGAELFDTGGPISRRTSVKEDIIEDTSEESIAAGRVREHKYKQILTFINFCIANFSTGVFYALLAPFFPREVSQCLCSPTA